MEAFATSVHRFLRQFGDSLIVLVVLLVIWQVVAAIVGAVGLSPPLATSINAVKLLFSADFWPDVRATMYPFLWSAIASTIGGIAIGLFLGLNKLARDVFEPVIVSLYSIPKLVFYPVILLVFGIDMASEVVFALIHGILPVMLFTMNAVRLLRPIYLKTARIMNLTPIQIWAYVALPAVIPETFTGLRVGYAACLRGVLFCEMFGSKNGLGFLLMGAIGSNRVDEIFSLTLLLVSFSVLMNAGLLAIDRRLHRRG